VSDRFEILGLALFGGICLAVFVSPTVILVWWLDRKSSDKPK
jgi:hypothetical protein